MTTDKCVDYHCRLYDDDIAVCSYSDLCFPEIGETMTNKSQDTKQFKASIEVSLVAINQYGDEIGTTQLNYSVYLQGTLLEIVTRLEGLKGTT